MGCPTNIFMYSAGPGRSGTLVAGKIQARVVRVGVILGRA